MKPKHTLLQPPVWLVLILVLVLTGLTACVTPSAPASEVVVPTAIAATTAVAEATVVSEPSPAGSVSVHPADLRTGLSDLDPVLEAIAGQDPAQIAATFRPLETGCTTAEGLGGPPKCAEGQPEGTVVSVFPVLESEGHFVTADNFEQLADSMEYTGLFGVYRVTSGAGPEEAYWPSGDYGVVLAAEDPLGAITLVVDEGNIVRIVFHYMGTPEQAFDSGRGEIVVPPLQ